MIEKFPITSAREISLEIIAGTITKDEAIAEYMRFGYSPETADMIYQDIKSEVAKARLGLL